MVSWWHTGDQEEGAEERWKKSRSWEDWQRGDWSRQEVTRSGWRLMGRMESAPTDGVGQGKRFQASSGNGKVSVDRQSAGRMSRTSKTKRIVRHFANWE